MLLGPVLDRTRAASILKNLHSLHILLRQLGRNVLYLASGLDALGYTVHYPGLASHPPHALLSGLNGPGLWLAGRE
jgi:methionine-gamma-lyase